MIVETFQDPCGVIFFLFGVTWINPSQVIKSVKGLQRALRLCGKLLWARRTELWVRFWCKPDALPSFQSLGRATCCA